ncbi:MAG: ROK family protein, partial [Deltaproteobacteria bacterium]|nr:ROK family protein [Deltaproteobacteria bacterium]
MDKIAVAVDLGGTNIRVAAIDEQGNVRKKIKRPSLAKEGKEPVVRNLLSAIKEIYQASPEKQIKGVGLGIAGAINMDKGIITQSPNFPGWEGYQIKGEIEAEFSQKIPVILENDANAAAMGERWKGAGIGINYLLCLTLGTGIGGGIIINGKLLHGADGMAGELGHITVAPDGPRCNCGNHGCLEALASATAIKREATMALKNRPESELNSRCGGNVKAITAEMVYHSATSGDLVSRKVYQTMGKYLGIGIASLVNIFNPEMVIIGGGVSKAWDLFGPYTKKEVSKRALKPFLQRMKIVP